MTISRLIGSLVKAPFLGLAGLILGFFASALLLLASFLIHMVGGIEQNGVSRMVYVIANYLPVALGAVGVVSAFLPGVHIPPVFGSARWATKDEMRDLSTTGDSGLLIGRDPSSGKLLRYEGPAHLMTMAPTRTGKGVGTIIPNLLTADRSIICIDPKGENAKVTASVRERFGPVHILDPFGVTGRPSAAFNPLDLMDPDSLDVAEDANADALVFDDPGLTTEAHWNEEAKALIAGLILKILVAESPGRRHLGTLREYLTLAPERFLGLLSHMQEAEEIMA